MKNKIVAFITAIFVVMSLNVVAASPASAVTCSGAKSTSTTVTNSTGTSITGKVTYRECVSGVSIWYEPISVTGKYTMTRKMVCGWEDPFQKVTFNFYLWDGAGRSINPPAFDVHCAPGAYANSYTHQITSNTRLYRVGGVDPKWKANTKEVLSYFTPDQDRVVGGQLS